LCPCRSGEPGEQVRRFLKLINEHRAWIFSGAGIALLGWLGSGLSYVWQQWNPGTAFHTASSSVKIFYDVAAAKPYCDPAGRGEHQKP
jgi:hypothetical protein